MSDQRLSPPQSSDEATARREFLNQVGKVAVTAPAVALLLAAAAQPAASQYGPQGPINRRLPHPPPP
jgi:hypothetical protein